MFFASLVRSITAFPRTVIEPRQWVYVTNTGAPNNLGCCRKVGTGICAMRSSRVALGFSSNRINPSTISRVMRRNSCQVSHANTVVPLTSRLAIGTEARSVRSSIPCSLAGSQRYFCGCLLTSHRDSHQTALCVAHCSRWVVITWSQNFPVRPPKGSAWQTLEPIQPTYRRLDRRRADGSSS